MVALKRALGFWQLLVYAIGVILGAGIYALVGKAAALTGGSVWLSFAVAAVVASFTALSYAELSSSRTKTAAEYNYVNEAFGSRLLAFMTGWVLIVAGIASSVTVALGFSGYFANLFFAGAAQNVVLSVYPILVTPVVVMAMVLLVALSFLNYWGIKISANLNTVFTIIEASGLALIILLGIFFVLSNGFPDVNLLEMPGGVSGVLGAVAIIFFAYLGFEELANMGEEVKEPKKNIPRAILWAIAITTIIYILVAVAAVTLLPPQQLGTSSAPLADAAGQVLGGNGGLLLSVIALFATSNTVLIMLIVNSRIIYGMAKQGSLPGKLAEVSEKRRTPWAAVLCTLAFTLVFCLFRDIRTVAELTNFGIFIVFAFVNLSLIKLRFERNPHRGQFRAPINIGRFPVLAGLGFVSCAAMLASYVVKASPSGLYLDFGSTAVMASAAVIVAAIPAYLLVRTIGFKKQNPINR
jgi:APA family basic amino acid/polyamine antiporter